MNRETTDRLFKLYYAEAKLYTFSLCHDMNLAEELVSESFFKAVLSQDDENGAFKFWLLKVCRNAFFDHVKRNKKHCELKEQSASSADDELVTHLIKKEEYAALYRAIDLLPAIYREVILLHYFDGLKVNEIASLTEQSADNVKVLMFRARGKLKDILEAKK